MYGILTWMESSALGHVMRESGPWTYAIVNLAHVFGISALFGAILILDLRLLGLWRRTPLAAVTAIASPVAAAGLALAVSTGAGLISANATDYAGNPFLLVKFPAIAAGVINAVAVRRSRPWRAHTHRDLTAAERRQLAVMGAISLGAWITAITAGRMIGYY